MKLSFDLALNFPVHHSYMDEYADGTVSMLLNRLLRWGVTFDPDRKIDVFTFGKDESTFMGRITEKSWEKMVQSIQEIPFFGESELKLSYSLQANMEHFGWKMPDFEGNILIQGLKKINNILVGVGEKKTLAIILCDGQVSDMERTRKLLTHSENQKNGIYFLILGVSNQEAAFPMLEELGHEFENVGFIPVHDTKSFSQMNDEKLTQLLIGEELTTWLNP